MTQARAEGSQVDATGLVAPAVEPEALVTEPGSERTAPAATDAGDTPPRPVKLLRSAPKIIWLLVLVHGLLVISWSVLTPIYHAPDEPVHVDAAVRLYNGEGWPVPGKAFLSDDGISAWAGSPYSLPSQPLVERPFYLPQADAVPRDQRPHWDQLSERYPLKGRHDNQIQQMVQHPPLYYAIEAAVIKILPGSSGYRWDVWVGIMRIVSALMVTTLPLIAWATCRALTRSRAAGLCAAITPFAIPQLSVIGGAVNNDNAVTLFSSLCLLGCVCAIKGNRSLRGGIFTGVSLGLALFSKTNAVVLLPVVLVSYLIGSRAQVTTDLLAEKRWVFRGSRVIKPLAMTYALGFVIGGWWYVFQKIRTGAFQPTVPNFPGGIKLDGRLDFADKVWRYMQIRFWGSAGWFEVSLPFTMTFVASLVVILLVGYGLVRSPGWRTRTTIGVLLIPMVVALLLVIWQAYRFWQHNGRLLGVQGRYLFVGVIGLAAALGLGVAALPRAVRRWAPIAFVAGAVYMQWQLIMRVIDVWWRPPHGTLRQAWGALSAYAVWQPSFVRVLFSVTAVAIIAAVVSIVVICVRRDGRRAVALSA